jgi:hypothetical protein
MVGAAAMKALAAAGAGGIALTAWALRACGLRSRRHKRDRLRRDQHLRGLQGGDGEAMACGWPARRSRRRSA